MQQNMDREDLPDLNKNIGEDFVKFKIGDMVSKPITGVCKVEDILYLDSQGEKEDKLYYLLRPMEDDKEKIYVPVSSTGSKLRLCLTKEEAWKIIEHIPEIEEAWTDNEKRGNRNIRKQSDPMILRHWFLL